MSESLYRTQAQEILRLADGNAETMDALARAVIRCSTPERKNALLESVKQKSLKSHDIYQVFVDNHKDVDKFISVFLDEPQAPNNMSFLAAPFVIVIIIGIIVLTN